MNTINIKALSEQVSHMDGSLGKIAPLVPKIPKDYSTTETDTGLKWINGKTIYRKVLQGKTSSTNNTLVVANDVSVLYVDGFSINASGYKHFINVFASNIVNIYASENTSDNTLSLTYSSAFADCDYELVVYYTKPDPAPGNREPDEVPEEEPETKKATKKKTTKKED